MLPVALLELRAMEAVEAAFELELVADEIGGKSEPLEVVAAQLGGLVRETEPVEGLAPRAAIVVRSGLLEVGRHRGTMYCGFSACDNRGQIVVSPVDKGSGDLDEADANSHR